MAEPSDTAFVDRVVAISTNVSYLFPPPETTQAARVPVRVMPNAELRGVHEPQRVDVSCVTFRVAADQTNACAGGPATTAAARSPSAASPRMSLRVVTAAGELDAAAPADPATPTSTRKRMKPKRTPRDLQVHRRAAALRKHQGFVRVTRASRGARGGRQPARWSVAVAGAGSSSTAVASSARAVLPPSATTARAVTTW